MADQGHVKEDYDEVAITYNDFVSTPLGQLELQLVGLALGNCDGLTVLDIGGGTGIHARQAIDAGAIAVDVVDLSPEMMRLGQSVERSLGRNCVNWYEADVSKPLDHLPMRSYDLVMANWVFDHALSVSKLEGMWLNVTAYLKPGGRFIGVRCGDPRAPCILNGKYGAQFKDHEDIPGGVKYQCVVRTDPPFDFEAASMKTSYSGSTEMQEKFGLHDVQIEPYESSRIIKESPEFWRLFLEEPSMVIVKAKKG